MNFQLYNVSTVSMGTPAEKLVLTITPIFKTMEEQLLEKLTAQNAEQTRELRAHINDAVVMNAQEILIALGKLTADVEALTKLHVDKMKQLDEKLAQIDEKLANFNANGKLPKKAPVDDPFRVSGFPANCLVRDLGPSENMFDMTDYCPD